MSQADPQSIKISGVTTSLPRVSTGELKSRYESSDGLIDLSFSTQDGKRLRQTARIDHTKIAADPLAPTLNAEYGMSVQLVIDRPKAGYTNAEALAICAGLLESLTATENAKITKLLAKES